MVDFNDDDIERNDPITYAYRQAISVSPNIKNKIIAEKDYDAIKKIVDAAHKLAAHKDDFTDKDRDVLQQCMKARLQAAAFAIKSNPDLQALVDLERQGVNPAVEGTLTQLIELSGTSLDQDIEYGREVPAMVRLQWQALGMDPDSENEVQEFLERNGITDARQPEADMDNTKKLR
ncbi:MAG: hypothetical protein AB7I18_12130 [Candidatus Berkiella sp.]